MRFLIASLLLLTAATGDATKNAFVGAMGGTAVAPFTPITNTYTTAGSATETVPDGATTVILKVWGAGGGGNWSSSNPTRCGGGGGGYSTKAVAVLSGEWGTTLSYTVAALGAGRTGSAGAGVTGGNSTISGTLNGTAVSMAANGGVGGIAGGGTANGGTASGGDTNTSGGATSNSSGGTAANGGFGDGGTGVNGSAGGNGEDGRVEFAWQ